VTELLVDPEVSHLKFAREVAQYQETATEYRRRGWILLKAEFPDLEVAFAAPHLWPVPLLFAVRVNFANYDLWAPSVRFIDAFDGHALTMAEARQRRISLPQNRGANFALGPNGPVQLQIGADLVQAHDESDLPFVCLPGIREYHDNPAHTGDPWLTHRTEGIGSLHNILDKLHAYGVLSAKAFAFNLTINISDIQRAPQP
jgi:hypothetical protein